MPVTYIQSIKTGRIYGVLPSAAEAQVKSGTFRLVDDARAERISSSTVRYGN